MCYLLGIICKKSPTWILALEKMQVRTMDIWRLQAGLVWFKVTSADNLYDSWGEARDSTTTWFTFSYRNVVFMWNMKVGYLVVNTWRVGFDDICIHWCLEIR